jgi:glutamate N-acetyltransferase / amino-acid N-acetyltransferase
MITKIEGGITAPNGFKSSGVHAGIKYNKKDFCMIFSEKPAVTAGVFTTNKVVAAPVVIDREQLAKNNPISAIVINSGIANACTGEQGMKDGWETINFTAETLKISPDNVLISSTGVIGKYLYMDKVKNGITLSAKSLSADNHLLSAQAIMTTDTFPKEIAYSIKTDKGEIKIGGIAKGSGMIKPNMATMLVFLSTDAAISKELLQESISSAINKSFNRISVDNDTSTNDMVIIMANGLSNHPELLKDTDEYKIFYNALENICIEFAKLVVKDGEGATKLIELNVKNADSEETALKAARTIADSYLVKTAIHGEDANWGRIIAAVGYSGIEFIPEKTSLKINNIQIIEPGFKVVFDEKDAKIELSKKEIKIEVDLAMGKSEATVWTSDLSKEYIAINANYRS